MTCQMLTFESHFPIFGHRRFVGSHGVGPKFLPSTEHGHWHRLLSSSFWPYPCLQLAHDFSDISEKTIKARFEFLPCAAGYFSPVHIGCLLHNSCKMIILAGQNSFSKATLYSAFYSQPTHITLSKAKYFSDLLAAMQFLGQKTNPRCIIQIFQSSHQQDKYEFHGFSTYAWLPYSSLIS